MGRGHNGGSGLGKKTVLPSVMESYLMIIFGGSGWTTEGHFKKWEMGVVAGILGNGRWGATDQGQSNI